ncbi:putative cystathionine gamma-synthase [Cladobotryum mycophilum]|uniref:Cystathionine gamma-synthase n=1 Tax=Cladobotryum mycophilum TaxID=491253 RepID=A0ABR0SMT9_9HYPO
MKAEAGDPLPLGEKHAVSVYFPTWKDTMGYATQDPAMLNKMKTGYPRFFVPRINRELAQRLVDWAASQYASDEAITEITTQGQISLLFPTARLANDCRNYLKAQNEKAIVGILGINFEGQVQLVKDDDTTLSEDIPWHTYVVTYPQDMYKHGKAFWQHAGYGVSSRWATFWIENAPFLQAFPGIRETNSDLPDKESEEAKLRIRKRIGDLLATPEIPVRTESVYLYPTGMSAISHSAIALRGLHVDSQRAPRVAVLGFLYVDTFKVLSLVHRFDCELYYYLKPSDLQKLEADLAAGLEIDALYTEFPGNPLLGAVDLSRLRELSKKHDFLVVVDDTVATSVNVAVLPYCDVVCTSLTKMFSGGCNVMGGSLVLNPQSEHAPRMRQILDEQFIDTYFALDAIVMDQNSSDFDSRVLKASDNALRIADQLRHHPAVETVYYPKGNPTEELYEAFKRPGKGYGYLLSVVFVKPEAAIAFHDALDVAIGPSLGTNFTLCCAYTLFGHYNELEWAAQFGVVEHLVRISIGIEDEKLLGGIVKTALDAAAKTL